MTMDITIVLAAKVCRDLKATTNITFTLKRGCSNNDFEILVVKKECFR